MIYYTSIIFLPLNLFLSLNMESIPIIFFIWLIACVTQVAIVSGYDRSMQIGIFDFNKSDLKFKEFLIDPFQVTAWIRVYWSTCLA